MNTDDVNSEGSGSSFGSPTLFRLTGVDTRLGDFFLEECLAGVLLRNGERERERRSGGGVPLVTVLEKEGGFDEPPGAHEPPAPARGGSLLFCLNPGDGWDCGGKGPGFPSDDDVLQKLEEYIASRSPSVGGENEQNQPSDGTATTFLRNPSVAAITVVDDESAEDDTDDRNVEYITEEEAYRLWLLDQQERQQAEEQAAEEPTTATGGRTVAVSRLVSSPDGELVVPRHASRGRGCGEPQSDRNGPSGEGKPSTAPGLSPATVRQLERDPGLLEFDNVPRVHYAEVVQHLRKASKSNGGTNNDGGCEALRGFGTRPVVVRGFRTGPGAEPGPLGRDLVSFRERLRATLLDKGAETVVRTGNRETLVENGFHNSRASLLGGVGVVEEALRGLAGEKGKSNGSGDGPTPDPDPTIVFNPIHELPPEFRAGDVLGLWLDHGGSRSPAGATPGGDGDHHHTNSGDAPEPRQRIFPNALWHLVLDEANANASGNKDSDGGGNKDDGSGSSIKFTLCMANEGFGIGMHKHGPALFFLTEGRKKWYLSHPDPIDRLLSCGEGGKTHPGFYRELSTHKCIQEPGELLLVPNLWYHEIYNLSPGPTIGIQALGGERPVPGDL